ncbi:hypothetical protein ABK040_009306 [Willaertia magna]
MSDGCEATVLQTNTPDKSDMVVSQNPNPLEQSNSQENDDDSGECGAQIATNSLISILLSCQKLELNDTVTFTKLTDIISSAFRFSKEADVFLLSVSQQVSGFVRERLISNLPAATDNNISQTKSTPKRGIKRNKSVVEDSEESDWEHTFTSQTSLQSTPLQWQHKGTDKEPIDLISPIPKASTQSPLISPEYKKQVTYSSDESPKSPKRPTRNSKITANKKIKNLLREQEHEQDSSEEESCSEYED